MLRADTGARAAASTGFLSQRRTLALVPVIGEPSGGRYRPLVVADEVERQGSEAVIPPRKHRCTTPRAFDPVLYRQRHWIEFLFNQLKQFRRVPTRYEKTARNYLAMVHSGCLRIWT